MFLLPCSLALCLLLTLLLCLCAQLLYLYPTLCDPTDCSLPGSSVHGILKARILEWIVMPFSRGSSWPGMEFPYLMSPALAGGFFTTRATWEAHPTSGYYLINMALYFQPIIKFLFQLPHSFQILFINTYIIIYDCIIMRIFIEVLWCRG